jgi:hypothetical protein
MIKKAKEPGEEQEGYGTDKSYGMRRSYFGIDKKNLWQPFVIPFF